MIKFFLSRKKYFRTVIRKPILSDGAESYYWKSNYSMHFYVEYKFFFQIEIWENLFSKFSIIWTSFCNICVKGMNKITRIFYLFILHIIHTNFKENFAHFYYSYNAKIIIYFCNFVLLQFYTPHFLCILFKYNFFICLYFV